MPIDRPLDLNLLRLLIALYRTRSVSRAAEQLNLSQPATSLALARLRKAVGDVLFVRTSGGMMPTSRCAELVAAADQALATIDSTVLRRSAFDPVTARQDFVVTMPDVGEIHFLPRLTAFLAQHAPTCNLRCEQITNEQMEAALAAGDIDLALGYFPNLEGPGVLRQRLFMHSLVCLVRADHPIVKSKTVPLATFLELSHAVVRSVGRSNELFEMLLKKQGLQRRIQLLSSHFLSVPAIISETDLIVTVPRSIADYYARLENLRIVEPPINIKPYAIHQFWHARFHKDPGLKWLRESVALLFTEPPNRARRRI
ncbi:LysR family transcriptional regulator [Bradyrhizobium commune]|uniref:LysR family transcriptional regulator n=2 Tax=Bradyrhizobium commune TaxID=83627 RepID=A0A7S9GYP4_9BRAD|nr:LysR family transcriptional regulator [Bradyrhizobium commune]